MRRLRHWALTTTVCTSVMTPAMWAPVAILPTFVAIDLMVTTTTMQPATAALPVIDAASIVEEVAQLVQMLKSYVVDINNWIADLMTEFNTEQQLIVQIKQLTTMLDQYVQIVYMVKNFIHSPSLGSFLGIVSVAGLRLDTLPLNVYAMQGVMSGYRSGSLFSSWSGVTGTLSSLFNTSSANDTVYRCSDSSFTCKQQQVRADAASGYKAAAGQVYSDIEGHNKALDSLRTTANGASDPKTVADVTAQATIENAWATNNATRMLAIQATAQAQATLAEEQSIQKHKRDQDEYLKAMK